VRDRGGWYNQRWRDRGSEDGRRFRHAVDIERLGTPECRRTTVSEMEPWRGAELTARGARKVQSSSREVASVGGAGGSRVGVVLLDDGSVELQLRRGRGSVTSVERERVT